MVDRDIEDFGLPDVEHSGLPKQSKSRQEEQEEENAADELRITIRELWKTGLEVFIHQLLYRRGVYPKDTFCSTRFVGVECKINNHPSVLQYIADALKEAIPMMLCEEADDCRLREVLIEIYDQATDVTHEEFSLFFSSSSAEEGGGTNRGLWSSFQINSISASSKELSDHLIEEIERDLRDLVCSTGKLERPPSLVWDDSVSFKIVLGFHNQTNNDRVPQSPMKNRLDSTKWTETRTIASNYKVGNRVLFHIASFDCQFQYRLMSTQDKTRAKKT